MANKKEPFTTTVRIEPELKERLDAARKKQPVYPAFRSLVTHLIDRWCTEQGT